mmetsp:Transcript_43793/g.103518  ORF Transcript_43793/g.103518 Transcript_43793/m.103518 type:complete len:200 (-) Transcript_43793:591-1190(-)
MPMLMLHMQTSSTWSSMTCIAADQAVGRHSSSLLTSIQRSSATQTWTQAAPTSKPCALSSAGTSKACGSPHAAARRSAWRLSGAWWQLGRLCPSLAAVSQVSMFRWRAQEAASLLKGLTFRGSDSNWHPRGSSLESLCSHSSCLPASVATGRAPAECSGPTAATASSGATRRTMSEPSRSAVDATSRRPLAQSSVSQMH